MAIEFTQFLRPDGRKRDMLIDMPEEIENLAEFIRNEGGQFEVEELRTGEVSLTAVFKDGPEFRDIAIEVVPNGPEVPAAVERLVRNAVKWLEGRK